MVFYCVSRLRSKFKYFLFLFIFLFFSQTPIKEKKNVTKKKRKNGLVILFSFKLEQKIKNLLKPYLERLHCSVILNSLGRRIFLFQTLDFVIVKNCPLLLSPSKKRKRNQKEKKKRLGYFIFF